MLQTTTLPNGASNGTQQNQTVIANPSASIGNAMISYSGQPTTNTQLGSNQATSNMNTIIAANAHPGHPQSGPMIIPFLQNLNEEVSSKYFVFLFIYLIKIFLKNYSISIQ